MQPATKPVRSWKLHLPTYKSWTQWTVYEHRHLSNDVRSVEEHQNQIHQQLETSQDSGNLIANFCYQGKVLKHAQITKWHFKFFKTWVFFGGFSECRCAGRVVGSENSNCSCDWKGWRRQQSSAKEHEALCIWFTNMARNAFQSSCGIFFAGNLKEFTADLSSSWFARVHVKGLKGFSWVVISLLRSANCEPWRETIARVTAWQAKLSEIGVSSNPPRGREKWTPILGLSSKSPCPREQNHSLWKGTLQNATVSCAFEKRDIELTLRKWC